MAAYVIIPVNGGVRVRKGVGKQLFRPTRLYVEDLHVSVDVYQLYELFSRFGPVVYIRLFMEMNTGRSLGYGYVNYVNVQDAEMAKKVLNRTNVAGKAIRVMYSARDFILRKSGSGNIFIKNLDKAIDEKALYDTFSAFGNILSCKIATDAIGQSKGYGFVQCDSEECAQEAIANLNGMLINDKRVYVGRVLHKQERDYAADKLKFTSNVFVQNLSVTTTDEDLNKAFSEHVAVTSAVVRRDAEGKSKCIRVVNFENAQVAAKALDALNGQKFDDKEWSQGLNLYVKNLDDTVSDESFIPPMIPRGPVFRYPGRNALDVTRGTRTSGIGPIRYTIRNGRQFRDASVPIPIDALDSALRKKRRTIVKQLEAEAAAGVTTMLLEMNKREVLHLLGSPEALKLKVAEVMDVLRNVSQQQQGGSPADKLAALSLNDGIAS